MPNHSLFSPEYIYISLPDKTFQAFVKEQVTPTHAPPDKFTRFMSIVTT
jgi:hypothetical protein